MGKEGRELGVSVAQKVSSHFWLANPCENSLFVAGNAFIIWGRRRELLLHSPEVHLNAS